MPELNRAMEILGQPAWGKDTILMDTIRSGMPAKVAWEALNMTAFVVGATMAGAVAVGSAYLVATH